MVTPQVQPAELHARIDALRESDLRRRRTMKWHDIDSDVLPAWVAEMDFPLPEVVREAVGDVLAREDFGYPLGERLQRCFAEWARREQAWPVDPAHVRPVADVMAGIETALRKLTEPGDGVAVLSPAYTPFLTVLDELRRPVHECRLLDTADGWCIDFDAVADALRGGARAVLLCQPHNPTGRVFSPAELAALAELVDRHGARVISDEIHAPLRAGGQAFTPYAASGELAAGHAVTVTSVSKGWNVAGLKCAVLVAGPDTAFVVDSMPMYERLRPSVPGVAAASALWTDDGGWLLVVRDYLDRTRQLLADWVRDRGDVRWHVGQAGYLAWLDFRETRIAADPAGLVHEKARVKLNAGVEFATAASPVGVGFARLNHATSLPLLREILDRIDGVL